MSQAKGFSLVLRGDREQAFLQRVENGENFAEPVREFMHSRNSPLVCFVVSAEGMITHLGLGRRGIRAGTGIRRLNVNSIEPLHAPLKTATILDSMPSRMKSIVRKRFLNSGLFSPKAFDVLVETLIELSPETRIVLDRFRRSRREKILQISYQARNSLAFQQQAIVTALSIAGIKRDELQEWSPPESGAAISFLDGLPSVRLREDSMVLNDLMKVPGFDFIESGPYSAAIFESDSERLTVILANRLPLEEQTGTDLVYFNETYQSFVMVQYKAMEFCDDEKGAIFRLPNPQLDEEIGRMDKLLEFLRSCNSNNHKSEFRLNENPFFLKLCPRIVFQPDDVGLIPGMYLPLDYWKILAVHPSLKGPKGGLRVTYENVGRYFDNTEFIKLVAKAWIGTNTNQSSVLKEIFREVLATGKAIAIAVKSNKAASSEPHRPVLDDLEGPDSFFIDKSNEI